MRTQQPTSGFALLLVLWTLAMLSAIALTLAASVATEIRSGQDSWDELQAERLAESGHEVVAYLGMRALGTASEDLSGLPVESVIAGFKYRLAFDIGTVDVLLEGENGKFDVGSAKEDDAAAFFTAWTGDPSRGREIAASIGDWIDNNDEARPMGAEASWYSNRGYQPRNATLGIADLFLIKGLTPGDFAPAIVISNNAPTLRGSLSRFISALPTGNIVNPNYASLFVLQTVPGMTEPLLESILDNRRNSVFKTREDFRNRTGLAADSAILAHLVFDRGFTPAVVAIASLRGSVKTSMERKTQTFIRFGARGGTMVLALVERQGTIE